MEQDDLNDEMLLSDDGENNVSYEDNILSSDKEEEFDEEDIGEEDIGEDVSGEEDIGEEVSGEEDSGEEDSGEDDIGEDFFDDDFYDDEFSDDETDFIENINKNDYIYQDANITVAEFCYFFICLVQRIKLS